MSGQVRVTDHGADALLARMREIKSKRVRVGVLDEKTKQVRGEGSVTMSLVEVAAVHEFGAPAAGIPMRSFIRATVDEHLSELKTLQEAIAKRVLDGKLGVDQALNQIGAKVASWCQKAIADGIDPPLDPATMKAKGSSKPLVDTGQLKASITWKIVSADDEEG